MIRVKSYKMLVCPLLFFLLVIVFQSNAQKSKKDLEGSVSYISGQSIYVKFESTHGIENGDTLFMNRNEVFIPVLVVQHHSSGKPK